MGLIFTKAFALVGKILSAIPWWAWPMLGLFLWGGYGHQQANSFKEKSQALQRQLDQEHADYKAGQAAAAEVAHLKARFVASLKGVRDEQDKRTTARLAATVELLQSRPDRRAEGEAAPEACKGTTGAELSRSDGSFLAGEAARADRIRAALAECYGWIDAVAPDPTPE